MEAVVLTIHLLLALALILVVLLQRSEGGGLGMGSGGIMTSRGAATALSKVTWAIGTAFVLTSLILTVLSAHTSGSSSVVDRLGTTETATPAPATATSPATPAEPGLQGDLLPATPATAPDSEGPAAPPPVK